MKGLPSFISEGYLTEIDGSILFARIDIIHFFNLQRQNNDEPDEVYL